MKRRDVSKNNEQKRRKQVNGQWPCTKCKQYKNPEFFDKNSRAWNGIETVCKDCRSHKRKTSKEREAIWESCMKKRYGISKDDYSSLLEDQGGVCAICLKADMTGRKLSVDHCHSTGLIRGLLCSKCNTALGLFNDDIILLVNAIDYLKKYII